MVLLVSVAAVAGLVFVPGPALYVFVALTSVGLYVPFSLQVTLGQTTSRHGWHRERDHARPGGQHRRAGRPAIGALADATSLQIALIPLIVMPALGWLMFRSLPSPPCTSTAATARGTGAFRSPVTGGTVIAWTRVAERLLGYRQDGNVRAHQRAAATLPKMAEPAGRNRTMTPSAGSEVDPHHIPGNPRAWRPPRGSEGRAIRLSLCCARTSRDVVHSAR